MSWRIKLEIFPDPSDSSAIKFVLSELKTGTFKQLGAGVKRGVLGDGSSGTPTTLERSAQEWRDGVVALEMDFVSTRKKLDSQYALSSRKKTPSQGQLEIPWAAAVAKIEETFMIGVGRLIREFSHNLRQDLLPERTETEFWRSFRKYIDDPSLMVESLPPLLQIQTDPKLGALPWWLSRTPDDKSLWGCRYALGFAPFLQDLGPPDINADRGLKILTITRPTYCLQHILPITAKTFRVASEQYRSSNLRWCMLDGFHGNKDNPSEGVLASEAPAALEAAPFLGVCPRNVHEALNSIQPDIWFYHGHWDNRQAEGVGTPPYLVLDDPMVPPSVRNIRRVAEKRASLLDTIAPPHKHRNSVFIMNACSSGGEPLLSQFITRFLQENSLFFGSAYPLLADMPGSSAALLLENILTEGTKENLAHLLRQAQELSTDLKQKDFDAVELYKKASLCLFGDVTAHLGRPVTKKGPSTEIDSTVSPQGSVSHIAPPGTMLDTVGDDVVLKITDNWRKALLEDIGLTEAAFDGRFTFKRVHGEELPATADYDLSDQRLEIALCPLATAILKCVSEPNDYVILGPGMGSVGAVGLAARSNFGGTLSEALKTFVANDCQFHIELKQRNLSSTYMVRFLCLDAIFSLPPNSRKRSPDWYLDFTYQSERASTREPDAVLVLWGKPILPQLDYREFLERDVEGTIARRLSIEYIPRGVFLGRKNAIADSEKATRLQDFFRAFNGALRAKASSDSPTGCVVRGKTVVFPSFDKAHWSYLRAIKNFADQIMYRNDPYQLSWQSFYCRPDVPQEMLARVLDSLPGRISEWAEELNGSGWISDKIKFGIKCQDVIRELLEGSPSLPDICYLAGGFFLEEAEAKTAAAFEVVCTEEICGNAGHSEHVRKKIHGEVHQAFTALVNNATK